MPRPRPGARSLRRSSPTITACEGSAAHTSQRHLEDPRRWFCHHHRLDLGRVFERRPRSRPRPSPAPPRSATIGCAASQPACAAHERLEGARPARVRRLSAWGPATTITPALPHSRPAPSLRTRVPIPARRADTPVPGYPVRTQAAVADAAVTTRSAGISIAIPESRCEMSARVRPVVLVNTASSNPADRSLARPHRAIRAAASSPRAAPPPCRG